MDKRVDFLGIKVSVLTTDEVVEEILEFALRGRYKMVAYLNANCVNTSFSDKDYRGILDQLSILYPDGKGVSWASRILKKPLPKVSYITDLFGKVAQVSLRQDISFYFLGGKPHIIQKAADNIKNKFPGIRILGLHHGYFNYEEERNIIEEINLLKPHILLIGMGVPKQEKWMYRHLNELEVNLCWGVGGMFDNLSDFLPRAPAWMSDIGLEWLYRLFQEPRRLWRRYLISNFIFIYRVLKWKLRKSFQRT